MKSNIKMRKCTQFNSADALSRYHEYIYSPIIYIVTWKSKEYALQNQYLPVVPSYMSDARLLWHSTPVPCPTNKKPLLLTRPVGKINIYENFR